MWAALQDWLSLLGGPDRDFGTRDTFPDESDWKRLLWLSATVLALCGVATGGAVTAGADVKIVASESSSVMLFLLYGSLAAIPYVYLAAAACRVPVTIAQALFTFLLLALPWLPMAVFIKALAEQHPRVVILEIAWTYLSALIIAKNFAQGISKVARTCPPYRVWISVAGFGLLVFGALIAYFAFLAR